MTLPKPDWSAIKRWLREQFPDVHHLPVDELHAWLGDHTRAAPMLVDIRNAAEHAISHLPGALLVTSHEHALRALADHARDTAIVAYCSVGVRSARLVRELKRHGFSNASNLDGALFEWANRSLPLVNAQGPARTVHPFDPSWGALLAPELRHPVG